MTSSTPHTAGTAAAPATGESEGTVPLSADVGPTEPLDPSELRDAAPDGLPTGEATVGEVQGVASTAGAGGFTVAGSPDLQPDDRAASGWVPGGSVSEGAPSVAPAGGTAGQVVEEPAVRRPPLARSRTDRWLAGVCAGVAEHLGVPTWSVRLGMVVLAPVYYLGIALYLLLWVVMPDGIDEREAPGLEAARHLGMRTRAQAWQSDAAPFAALALLAGGSIWLANSLGLGLSNPVLWPAVFAVCGVALVWRQADAAEPSDADTAAWMRPLLRRGGWPGLVRMVVGMLLVGFALSLVAASRIGIQELPTVLVMALLMLLGVMIAAAPWMYRARRNLSRAREEKLVADTRADMAAHLHDSVLQSLALIQRQADNPKAVTRIARRQERELRTWLYGDVVPTAESVKAALTRDALDIEADRGVSIELVVVGDAPMTENTEAITAAAREAMVNSAKHSGVDSMDVFCEVNDGICEVFVRDRGRGFDLDTIDEDRMGVRRSLIDRMERHGGTARIRSAPGEGTDIRLSIPVEAPA